METYSPIPYQHLRFGHRKPKRGSIPPAAAAPTHGDRLRRLGRNLYRTLVPVVLLLALSHPAATAQERTLRTETVTVRAQRSLRDIGAQKTPLDTTVLRENITNSLADVLSQNSSIFIKSYGRGTLATASFRGTAPSHTQVTWNGMKMNSPMLGMVDFSLIPSYLIDDAALYHGASSVGVTGGGLGGAVSLGTHAAKEEGLGLKFVQGISSFDTYDEFLRIDWGNRRWQTSTRFYYVTSENDFPYTNYRKKEYETDPDGEIVGYHYPEERNRNGEYRDLHVVQDLFYDTGNGNRWGLSVWYLNSRRGVPMLNVDYKTDSRSRNQQDEQTLRAVASWNRLRDNLRLSARAGYTYTDLGYHYWGDPGGDEPLVEMIRSQSYAQTLYGEFGADYYLGDKWLFTARVTGNQHFVQSSDRTVTNSSGGESNVGYDEARFELSGLIGVKYRPTERVGLGLDLREEVWGRNTTPLIPALFVDVLLSRRGQVLLKASAARNYRYPTLNDLYFMPGGNDTLKAERGWTYDAGVEFTVGDPQLKEHRVGFKGEVTAYNSWIDNWITWLPTFKGFWSPVNVRKVHAYGLEVKANLAADLGRGWHLGLDGNFAITRSINHGDPQSWADESIGKQLVYIPVYSASVTGRLSWRSWMLTYKWNYYSERYTTSSNETTTRFGVLAPYFMNDLSIEKRFSFRWAELSVKGAINNLFNEEYESVLSRPMARRNYGLFIGFSPRWGNK